jgi:hypothetical protein
MGNNISSENNKMKVVFPLPARPSTRAYARQLEEIKKMNWREKHDFWLAQQPESVQREERRLRKKLSQRQARLEKELQTKWKRDARNAERDLRLSDRNDRKEYLEWLEHKKTVPVYRSAPTSFPREDPRTLPGYFRVGDHYDRRIAESPWYYPPQAYTCWDVEGEIVPTDDPRWEPPAWMYYQYTLKGVVDENGTPLLDADGNTIMEHDLENTPQVVKDFIAFRNKITFSYLLSEWIFKGV